MQIDNPAKVLRIRNFFLLTMMTAISQLGDRLTHMVLVTLIAALAPGKVFAFSAVSIFFTLPVIIVSPFAGVLIDRWNKRKVMGYCHYIQTAALIATPTAIALAHSMWPVWITVFLFFGLDLFNNASKSALLPELVARRKFMLANSTNQLLARVATILGMVAGGFLIAWTGWRYGFYVDSITHFTAGTFALLMVLPARLLPHRPHGAPQPSLTRALGKSLHDFFADLGEIFIVLRRDPLVLFVMTSSWTMTFISAVAYTILIFIVQQTLGLGTGGVGLMGGIMAVGMVAGSTLLGLLGRDLDRPRVILISFLVLSLFFLVGPFLLTVWFIALVSLVSGAAFAFITIANDTILCEQVRTEVRGRIFSTKEFVSSASFLVSAVLIGGIADLASHRWTLTVIGAVLVALTVTGFFVVRRIPRATA